MPRWTGEKVDSVTLEPGQTWLTFSLFGDKSKGFELDDVQVTSGTLSQNGSAFVLKDIHQDVTVSFSTKDMVLTVTFVSSQAATVEPASVEIPWGGTVTPATATRDGYSFQGWYTEPTLENAFDFSQPIYESVTLYAKWGAKVYTVNFMDGEDVLFTQQVRHGARVERPASPEKEGYLFAGWYADPELTTAYNFYSAIHADTNIYASWLVDDRADYIYLGGNESGNANYGVLGDDAQRRLLGGACGSYLRTGKGAFKGRQESRDSALRHHDHHRGCHLVHGRSAGRQDCPGSPAASPLPASSWSPVSP